MSIRRFIMLEEMKEIIAEQLNCDEDMITEEIGRASCRERV